MSQSNSTYTPATFAIPPMNTAPQGQIQTTQQQPEAPRRRGRPPKQPAASTAPTPYPGISATQVPQPPVHPAYKPPTAPPQPQQQQQQQQNLIQVDAENFTRLVQQVQSHQATINSLLARIDILEQARFSSHFASTSTNAANTPSNGGAAPQHNHQAAKNNSHGNDDDNGEEDSDSNSPIHQLLTEINQSQTQQQQSPWTPTPLISGWRDPGPNFQNPFPPPDQVQDMAYPPEGTKFAFSMTIDPVTGRKWIGGGSQGASAVLNAWTGPHGYRLRTRRSKLKTGRYYLTMCCAYSADKYWPRSVKEAQAMSMEEIEYRRRQGYRMPPTRNSTGAGADGGEEEGDEGEEEEEEEEEETGRDVSSVKYTCPFRFVMRQVDKDIGLFEVRMIRVGGNPPPHNHGPDPLALRIKRYGKKFELQEAARAT